MALRPFTIALLAAALPGLAVAAPSPTPPEPPDSASLAFVPCAPGGHQVTLFSEGTAWMRGLKSAWLTVYNPTPADQDVWVRIYVDGRPNPLKRHVLLAPHTRHAWHVNDEIVREGNPALGDYNFGTEVFFDTVGVANVAVWDVGAGPVWQYLRAAYLKGTDRCVTW